MLGFNEVKKTKWMCMAALGLCCLLALLSCSVFRSPPASIECSLVELTKKPGSNYYEAVIRLESVDFENAYKSRFHLLTPTSFFECSELNFTEEGMDQDVLEPGDTFVVPLQRPDWIVSLRENDEILCVTDFWDKLPAADQWHPAKTEAMEVAQNIEIDFGADFVKPAVKRLPSEWFLVAEELPEPENPYGTVQYQKLRGDIIREEVFIQYTYMTEDEKGLLDMVSPPEALMQWIEWAREEGQVTEMNGRTVVFVDYLDPATFNPVYRYAYVDEDIVLDVTVLSDPLEWQKSEQEKSLERRTDKVFLWYGFDDGQAQVLIEVRMDREGTYRRMLKSGEPDEKDFQLEESEFAAIERALRDNRFTELQSRSGPPGGVRSFLTVQFIDSSHAVEMNNVNEPLFKNIEDVIRKIVLPKVTESSD
jgi:hypothetical protein